MDSANQTNSTRDTKILSISFGVMMVVFGLAALVFMKIAAANSIMLLGRLLAAAGVLQVLLAFMPEQRSHVFIGFFVGLTYLLVGVAMLNNPTVLLESLAVYMSLFLGVVGMYKVAIASLDRFHNWGWVAFNGAVTFLLAAYLWYTGSTATTVLVSSFVGVEFLLWGTSFFFVPFSSMEAMHHGIGGMHHHGGAARH